MSKVKKKQAAQYDKEKIVERIKQIGGATGFLEDLLDKIPLEGERPENIKKWILNNVLNSDEIKKTVDQIKNRRVPRLVLIGPSGVGKSSLLNALASTYIADISHIEVGTTKGKVFGHKINGELAFEILDSRGIGEFKQSKEISAEDQLKDDILKFQPDAILFLKRCKERAKFDKDIDFLIDLQTDSNFNHAPIICVLTQADEVEDSALKFPEDFNEGKLTRIEKEVEKMTKVLKEKKLKVEGIIPVSSYIKWEDSNGEIVDDLEEIPNKEKKTLKISKDGRYNINKLEDLIIEKICSEASIGMMLHTNLFRLQKKISQMLTKSFAGASAGVAALSPPVGDLPIITTIQALLVSMIAYISGKKLSIKEAFKFLASLGGIGGSAFIFRALSGMAVKLIPAIGQGISSTIAFGGTFAIGKAAESYYISEESLDDVKKEFEREFKKVEQ